MPNISQSGDKKRTSTVDKLQDLEKDCSQLELGDFDLIRYLDAETDSLGSSDTLVASEDRKLSSSTAAVNRKMEANNGLSLSSHGHHASGASNANHLPQFLAQGGGAPLLHHRLGGAGGNGNPSAAAASYVRIAAAMQQQQQQQQAAAQFPNSVRHQPSSYDPHVLPESPPETDSGAASAGSPSGSEASPCSPNYHILYQGQQQGSSVIVPGGGNGIVPRLTPVSSELSQSHPGVILSAQGLGFPDYNQYNTRVNNMNGHNLGGGTQLQPNVDYFANQMGHNIQQVSPPHHNNGPYPSYDLPTSSFPPHSDSLSRKRPRMENGQFVKPEPSSPPVVSICDENAYPDESGHQSIKFLDFQTETWNEVCDITGRELTPFGFQVVADKGFNYIQFDTSFVNQKKNHFQVTVSIKMGDPIDCQQHKITQKFVRTSNGHMRPVSKFELDFFGVKAEMHSHVIKIRQSQTDRKPVDYKAVELDLEPGKHFKTTVARLHFSETTMNNQRKSGKPNADQKYFLLVSSLNAILHGGERCRVMAYASERVIVRASNPGQFDNGDSEVHWQKGQNNSIYHPGPVSVGTDNRLGTLTVAGDIHYTGNLCHASDIRIKENIKEIAGPVAIENMKKLTFYEFDIKKDIAEEWGLSEEERRRKVGVLAQEVEEILPDAVNDSGDYLVVNDNRIFHETAMAVKELCFVTGHMENRINGVEKLNRKIMKLTRLDSLKSTVSSLSLSKAGSIWGSYISCSNSTIDKLNEKPKDKHSGNDKNGKNDEAKARKTCQYHHYHMCRRASATDQGLCNNKVIHWTVVVLLAVMAFCLLAMATLYFLDWYGRHSWGLPYPAMFPTTANSNNKGGGDHQIEATLGGVALKPTKRPQESLGLMSVIQNVQHSSTPNPASRKKLPGGLEPLHSCNHLRCDEYCCGQMSYDIQISDEIGIGSGRNGPDSKSPHSNIRLLLVAKNVGGIGRKFRRPRQTAIDISDQAAMSADSKNLYEIVNSSEFSTPPAKGLFKSSVRLLGSDNITLDKRYCMTDDCLDANRGNFSFYVPISRYMPYMPLNINFDVGPNDQTMFCKKTAGPLCFGLDATALDSHRNLAQVQQRARDMWELPVGLFFNSYYTFRIGPSTTLCTIPDDEAGASFVEYNLWFNRVCG